MKRILFIIPYLTTGGTNRSLQNLLNFIDTSCYQADVFVLAGGGLYRDRFKNGTLLPVNWLVDATIGHMSDKKGLKRGIGMLCKLACKLTGYKFRRFAFRHALRRLDIKSYDVVVAYSEGVATEFAGCLVHPNKIGWIHCEYGSYFDQNNHKNESDIYDSFRSVVCVSDFTRESFLRLYPQYKEKTYAVPNLIDDAMMKSQAKESVETDFEADMFNIVSVGRIDPVKRLSLIPEIAHNAHVKHPEVVWHIIGPKGGEVEYSKLCENITKYDCAGYVIILGEKDNPYPYIKLADLIVVPSKSEACPYVVNEAKVLGTPVIAADFGSACELITDGENGLITPVEEIDKAISRLIEDKGLYSRIQNNLSDFKYDNGALLKRIYELFDGKNH